MKVGILGGGQLGQMLALSGVPLGLTFRFLDPSPEAPARLVGEHLVAGYTDATALDRFSDGLTHATFEFENVPIEAARFLESRTSIYPPSRSLEIAQDRLLEKDFFSSLSIPTVPHRKVDSLSELGEAMEEIGRPCLLKTRRFGYDGKGQFLLERIDESKDAWERLQGVPLLLEKFVPFLRELSLIGLRSRSGETRFYPLVENHHRGGILRISRAPAWGVSNDLQDRAQEYGRRLMEELDYCGILVVEFFQLENDLLASEMACRVHNSGHWTIEGALTSQFENHLRAGLGLPLGSTDAFGYSAMVNLIGELPQTEKVLECPGARLHLYGKAAAPGRKLGHITIVERSSTELEEKFEHLLSLLGEREATASNSNR